MQYEYSRRETIKYKTVTVFTAEVNSPEKLEIIRPHEILDMAWFNAQKALQTAKFDLTKQVISFFYASNHFLCVLFFDIFTHKWALK